MPSCARESQHNHPTFHKSFWMLILMRRLRPTLMGSNAGQNIADAGWQVRVIDTILQNTYQIFDDD